MTNREEDEFLSQTVIEDHKSSDHQSPRITTIINKSEEDSGRNTLNGSEGSSEAQNGTNSISAATEVTAPESNGIITELHWSENPPSSASPSSGFSDDDSLTGANDVGDAKTIQQIVEMVKQFGKKGLIKEYAEIRSRQPEGTFENAKNRNNLTKNRYTDVLCYDHSRVVLSRENDDDDDPTNDYINANFVDGYKQKNAYISTQGKTRLENISCLHLPLNLFDRYRTTPKNSSRFLANGVGSTMFGDCDDDENHGERSREMSPVLGVFGRRNERLWKLFSENDFN